MPRQVERMPCGEYPVQIEMDVSNFDTENDYDDSKKAY